jgi:preprotein translocase subunit YajC
VHLTSHVLAVLAAGSSGASSGGGGGGGAFTFLPLILIVLVGYFLLIRPARMRQRKAMASRGEVTPGVEVTTTAGLLATVISVNEEDDTLTLEIAPGVQARFVKGAIARVNTPPEPEPVPEPEAPAGEHESIDAESIDPEPEKE